MGVENDEDGYIDVDSGDYDEPLSPPSHNIHCQGSCHSLTLRNKIPVEDDHEEIANCGRHADTELLPRVINRAPSVSPPHELQSPYVERDVSPVCSEGERVDYEPPTDPVQEEDSLMHIVMHDAIKSPVSTPLINVCSVPCKNIKPPLSEPHLLWQCSLSDFSDSLDNPRLPVMAMMDIGSPFVLIRMETVIKANL